MSEMARICAIPRVEPQPVDLNPYLLRGTHAYRLRPVQSLGLAVIAHMRGLLGFMRVGSGKTLLCALAGTMLRAKYTIVLTSAPLVADMDAAYRDVACKYFHTYGTTKAMSYDALSGENNSEVLDRYLQRFGSELAIVADECHSLRDLTRARTIRLGRLLLANPTIPFVAVSGTITRSSLYEYAHLADWALRASSPVPRPSYPDCLRKLADCMDLKSEPDSESFRYGEALAMWAGIQWPSREATAEDRKRATRSAHFIRLKSAPGVVVTESSDDYNGKLTITKVKLPIPENVQHALADLAINGLLPNGDVAEDPLSQWRAEMQIATGFFYFWQWPNGIKDQAWIDARREWHKFVRAELTNSASTNYDSPSLVKRAVESAMQSAVWHPGIPLYRAWLPHSAKRWNGQDTPPTVGVVLSDFLVREAVALTKGQPPTLIWYASDECAEMLKRLGIDCFGSGSHLPRKARTIGISWRVFKQGKNLQDRWYRMIVLEPPASGEHWEQLIGRVYRSGQPSDHIDVLIPQHATPYINALRNALNETREYMQTLTTVPLLLTRATFAEG